MRRPTLVGQGSTRYMALTGVNVRKLTPGAGVSYGFLSAGADPTVNGWCAFNRPIVPDDILYFGLSVGAVAVGGDAHYALTALTDPLTDAMLAGTAEPSATGVQFAADVNFTASQLGSWTTSEKHYTKAFDQTIYGFLVSSTSACDEVTGAALPGTNLFYYDGTLQGLRIGVKTARPQLTKTVVSTSVVDASTLRLYFGGPPEMFRGEAFVYTADGATPPLNSFNGTVSAVGADYIDCYHGYPRASTEPAAYLTYW
jgi:hypothetical protein